MTKQEWAMIERVLLSWWPAPRGSLDAAAYFRGLRDVAAGDAMGALQRLRTNRHTPRVSEIVAEVAAANGAQGTDEFADEFPGVHSGYLRHARYECDRRGIRTPTAADLRPFVEKWASA